MSKIAPSLSRLVFFCRISKEFVKIKIIKEARASGVLNQKTACQPKSSTKTPPAIGPKSPPIAKINVNKPTAYPLFSSGYNAIIIAGATLVVSPVPIPCRKRKKRSDSKLQDKDIRMNEALLIISPIKKIRR